MRRPHRVRWIVVIALAVALLAIAPTVRAADTFAAPAFQGQWQTNEAATPNFWGPLTLATDGLREPYADAPGGQRLVQYFDKGRMELTDPAQGQITNGRLAWEMVMGMIQTGDTTFQKVSPPTIPLAGDDIAALNPRYPGKVIVPTSYQTLQTLHAAFLDVQPAMIGAPTTRTISHATTGDVASNTYTQGMNEPQGVIATYDVQTGHNVPTTFATYRDRVGLATIGLAIAEPFWENLQVGGVGKDVLIQVFERRVLTFTPTNPDPFRVEFGNTGLHYYIWRYGSPGATPPPFTQPPPPVNVPVTGVCTNPARATIVSAPAAIRPTVPVAIAARVYDDQGRLCGNDTRVIIAAEQDNASFVLLGPGGGSNYVIATVKDGVATATITVHPDVPHGPAGPVTVNVYPNAPSFSAIRPAPLTTMPWQPAIL